MELKLGDLVLLETEKLKQFQWPVARVVELIKGADGIVRTVRVRTKGSSELLRRNIHEIFPLESTHEDHQTLRSTLTDKEEIENVDNVNQSSDVEMGEPSHAPAPPPPQPRRSARIAARTTGEPDVAA